MVSEGLASMMAYGDGGSNTIKHSYGGTVDKPKKKVSKKKVKK